MSRITNPCWKWNETILVLFIWYDDFLMWFVRVYSYVWWAWSQGVVRFFLLYVIPLVLVLWPAWLFCELGWHHFMDLPIAPTCNLLSCFQNSKFKNSNGHKNWRPYQPSIKSFNLVRISAAHRLSHNLAPLTNMIETFVIFFFIKLKNIHIFVLYDKFSLRWRR